jgi:hypothetical protein
MEWIHLVLGRSRWWLCIHSNELSVFSKCRKFLDYLKKFYLPVDGIALWVLRLVGSLVGWFVDWLVGWLVS